MASLAQAQLDNWHLLVIHIHQVMVFPLEYHYVLEVVPVLVEELGPQQ